MSRSNQTPNFNYYHMNAEEGEFGYMFKLLQSLRLVLKEMLLFLCALLRPTVWISRWQIAPAQPQRTTAAWKPMRRPSGWAQTQWRTSATPPLATRSSRSCDGPKRKVNTWNNGAKWWAEPSIESSTRWNNVLSQNMRYRNLKGRFSSLTGHHLRSMSKYWIIFGVGGNFPITCVYGRVMMCKQCVKV